ncbi:MAG: TolB family protein, partial [Planctomycetota bacterium]
MRVKKPTLALAVVGSWLTGLAAAEDRLTVWATFDTARIGPVVACQGELSAGGGAKVGLSPWMHNGKDDAAGAKFQLTTEHDAATAAAAKLLRVRRTTLPKGLLLEIDRPGQSTLTATTTLGDFDVSFGELRSQGDLTVLDGKIRLRVIPNVRALTGSHAEEEYASAAVLPDGRIAVAYVAWDGKADRVLVQVDGETRQITGESGDYLDPRCAVDARGKLWVVWAANDGRSWDLWAQSDGEPIRLTSSPRNDFWPRLARDGQGRIWLAWQTVAEDLHYEVMLARLGPDGLSTPVNVSQHGADDWEPALCATSDGRLVVAWDTYRNGSFDVYLRELTTDADGRLKAPKPAIPVAAGAEREAHATIAADRGGRVWLAWDVTMEDWGKHPV